MAITDIYAKMKPDAAAQQLTALDDETAAAVITKLNPRVASALMAEMDPKQAARLTSIISSSAKGPKGKPPRQARPGEHDQTLSCCSRRSSLTGPGCSLNPARSARSRR